MCGRPANQSSLDMTGRGDREPILLNDSSHLLHTQVVRFFFLFHIYLAFLKGHLCFPPFLATKGHVHYELTFFTLPLFERKEVSDTNHQRVVVRQKYFTGPVTKHKMYFE